VKGEKQKYRLIEQAIKSLILSSDMSGIRPANLYTVCRAFQPGYYPVS